MKKQLILLALAAATIITFPCNGRGGQEKKAPGIVVPGVDRKLMEPFKPAEQPVVVVGKTMGRIDWGRRVVIAQGRARQEGEGTQAKLGAQRAAGVVAIRNAAAIGAGVPVGINGTLSDLKNGTMSFQAHVKGIEVKRYRSETKRDIVYWIAEVEIPLFGIRAFAARIYDSQLARHRKLTKDLKTAAWVQPLAADHVAGDVLIIDARDLQFQPSMFPLIVDESGSIIYDMRTATKQAVCRRGMCAYATTKVTFDRLGAFRDTDTGTLEILVLCAVIEKTGKRRPRLIAVRAKKARGKKKAVLVIADKDSRKMVKDPRAAALVKKGKVVVVVDAPAAGMEGLRPPLNSRENTFFAKVR